MMVMMMMVMMLMMVMMVMVEMVILDMGPIYIFPSGANLLKMSRFLKKIWNYSTLLPTVGYNEILTV